jgi:hypothetical protein
MHLSGIWLSSFVVLPAYRPNTQVTNQQRRITCWLLALALARSNLAQILGKEAYQTGQENF